MIPVHLPLMERLAFWAGMGLMLLLAVTTMAPYACAWQGAQCHVPDNLVRLLDQNQNTVQNLAIYLFGFLFGTSVGKRKQEDTIDTLAKTAQTAGAALSGVATDAEAIVLAPGEQATATATESGTVIDKGASP